MARNKYPIHTTLNVDAFRILERYQKEFGAKNIVLEKALLNLDGTRFKGKLDPACIEHAIKRISSGIPGLDECLEGGIPKGFAIVVTGPPGTGKTTLCMQSLVEGARNNEKCIFFSFEEHVDQLVRHFMRFDPNIVNYLDDGYLEIFGMSMLTSEEIIEIIESCNPERIVFDSLNAFATSDEFRASGTWRGVHRLLKRKGITSFFITEKMHGIETRKFDDFDFLGDGIIFLDSIQTNRIDTTPMPVMAIQKMRATRIDSTPKPFRFTNKGIAKFPEINSSKVLEERLVGRNG